MRGQARYQVARPDAPTRRVARPKTHARGLDLSVQRAACPANKACSLTRYHMRGSARQRALRPGLASKAAASPASRHPARPAIKARGWVATPGVGQARHQSVRLGTRQGAWHQHQDLD